MKKFYKITNGLNFRQIPSVSGHNSALYNFNGNEIYYLAPAYIEQIQGSPLSIFSTEEFNMLQSSIKIEDIISYSPTVPVDTGWYLVSDTETLYDNLATIALGTNLVGLAIGSSVTTNGTASGIVVSLSGTTPQIIVVKYNGNSFNEGDLIQQDTEFHSGSATRTINVGSSVIVGDFSTYAGCLAYYDTSDTVNVWKYLLPFNDLLINYKGIEYKWKTTETTDHHWKINRYIYNLTEYDDFTVGTTNMIVASSKNVMNYKNGVYSFKSTALGTSITMRAEGSNDNSTWFNLDASNADSVIATNNSVNALVFENKYYYTRLLAVSDSGGTPILTNISLYLTNY